MAGEIYQTRSAGEDIGAFIGNVTSPLFGEQSTVTTTPVADKSETMIIVAVVFGVILILGIGGYFLFKA